MPEPPRTQRYEGLFPSQTKELFEADARRAAAEGWYPISETWSGGVLIVVYEQGGAGRGPVPAADGGRYGGATPSTRSTTPSTRDPSAPEGSEHKASRTLVGVVAAVAVVAVVMLALVGYQSMDRPATVTGPRNYLPNPTPTPRPSNLGTRPDAVAFLKSLGFSTTLDPLEDGGDRWLGRDRLGDTAQVVGPTMGVTKVSLTVPVDPGADPSTSAGAGVVAAVIGRFLPEAASWAADQLTADQVLTGETTARRVGKLTVQFVPLPVSDGTLLTFVISAG